jgi:hypothetical protein
MTDTMTSQNIVLSSWDTLYIVNVQLWCSRSRNKLVYATSINISLVDLQLITFIIWLLNVTTARLLLFHKEWGINKLEACVFADGNDTTVRAIRSLACINQHAVLSRPHLRSGIKIIMLRAIILFQGRPENCGHPEQSPNVK